MELFIQVAVVVLRVFYPSNASLYRQLQICCGDEHMNFYQGGGEWWEGLNLCKTFLIPPSWRFIDNTNRIDYHPWGMMFKVLSSALPKTQTHWSHKSLKDRKRYFNNVCTAQPNLNIAYESVYKSFRTGRLERELQMVQLSATRNRCITILWVSLVSFAAINLCFSTIACSCFLIDDSVRKLLDTPSYLRTDKKPTHVITLSSLYIDFHFSCASINLPNYKK
jgi:hypothetical protein